MNANEPGDRQVNVRRMWEHEALDHTVAGSESGPVGRGTPWKTGSLKGWYGPEDMPPQAREAGAGHPGIGSLVAVVSRWDNGP